MQTATELSSGSLVPEKWEPFVKINYAFPEGAEAINQLTDEYAMEHNVQNPPLEER